MQLYINLHSQGHHSPATPVLTVHQLTATVILSNMDKGLGLSKVLVTGHYLRNLGLGWMSYEWLFIFIVIRRRLFVQISHLSVTHYKSYIMRVFRWWLGWIRCCTYSLVWLLLIHAETQSTTSRRTEQFYSVNLFKSDSVSSQVRSHLTQRESKMATLSLPLSFFVVILTGSQGMLNGDWMKTWVMETDK